MKIEEEEEEVGLRIGEKCFPFGDNIILKVGCRNFISNLEATINSESPTYDENDSDNIEKYILQEEEPSPDELQDHKIFFENTVNCIQNPRLVVKECIKATDPYDEDIAEVKYMYSKPVAFFILGKPSLDNMKFGKKLATDWDCMYIDPVSCFDTEPDDKESPALLWCRKYLSEGNCIPNEMVMRIMEQRALSDEAIHRGFVMCGLPFAQQNGESSAQEQMHMIFSWPFEPKIFIYVTCPNVDVIAKNQQMCYDTTTRNYINKSVFSSHKELLDMNNYEPQISTIDSFAEDISTEMEKEKKLVSENDVNHLIVMPEPNIQYILPRYQQAVLPLVELYVAQIHPQYIIRVDGRTTPTHMLKTVKARLETLRLQPVNQPLPMFKLNKPQVQEQKRGLENADSEHEFGEEEEEEEEFVEEEDEFPFEFENLDEAYKELCHKDTVGIQFKWQKSNWKYLCPVSLSAGKVVEGEAKYSARFLNKIYFLSSAEALNAFLKNPRLYLLPPNPQPSCKFIVVGHEYAGKSTIAAYLAHVFRGKVINLPLIIQEQQKKISEIQIQRSQKITIHRKMKEIYQERKDEYEAAEENRKRDIEIWQQLQLETIENMNIPDYNENVEVLEDMFSTSEEKTSQPIDFNAPLIPQLSFARCRWLKRHPDELLRYLPDELKFPTPLPQVVTEDDPSIQEFMESITDEEEEEEEYTELSFNVGELLVNAIQEVQKELLRQSKNKKLDGGWVIDDMSLDLEVWQHLANENIVPEVVISLQDHSPEYSFLKEKKGSQLQEIEFDPELINRYAEKLEDFDKKWSTLQESIAPIYPPINIDIANKELEKIKVEVGQRIQALYHVSAEVFTDEDRDEERNASQHFEEMETEEEEKEEDKDDTQKKRRMGETTIYCPVAYQSNRVLWKGKEDLLAKYKGKVYTFSSEEAMEKFMSKPWEFVNRHNAEKHFPPLRICVVGPVGSGKTELGKLLSRTFGLIHKDFSYEINHTLLPKHKPIGRKVKFLEGRYIKTDSKVTEEEGEYAYEQSEENSESESEENDSEFENKNMSSSIEKYLADGTPMPEIILQKILTPLWANKEFQCSGFIISGFPWHPEDIDVMKTNILIPDVIICLSIQSEEIAKERLLKEMKEFDEKETEKRRRQAEKEQEKLQATLAAADREYGSPSLNMEIKNIILSYLQKSLPKEEENNQFQESGSIPADMEGTEEEDEEEDIRMQYEEEISEWFESDKEKLESIKTLAEEHNIDWLDIRGDNETQDVCLQVVHEVHPLKLRSASTFEQTFPITTEVAEQLLKSGYYFLSQFGKWCPVQLAAGEIPIQLYATMNQKAQIFPVIHRRFIYFLGGQENLELFTKDPLKYTSNIEPMPSIPVKIAIIGPPKSGKSMLANRLSKELSIKVITMGQAIRYVLDDLKWTELANSVNDILRKGEIVPVKMALRCGEAATMDPRNATQGYVFDGFPVSNEQINEMVSLNLFPYLIISLECTLSTCQTRLQSVVATFGSQAPVFSSKLLQHKYSCWRPTSAEIKIKLTNEYDNMFTLDADHTIWWLYDKTTKELYSVLKSINNYYNDILSDKPGKLEYMCVGPDEFKDRQSKYLHYCPGCLVKGLLQSGGIPPKKTGLVQYKVHYYWLCDSHMPDFLKNPTNFLPPSNKAELPEDIPYIPTDNEDFEIANDGYCIVTYTERLPEMILNKGSPEYPVIYGKKKYLFANSEQRNKFLRNPALYSNRKICMLPLSMPHLSIQRFPTLGFLEQTVSTEIHSVLLRVAEERPKYPGLPLDLSVAIYLGYHLKLMNPHTSCTQVEILSTAQKEFMKRCEILRQLCQKTKIKNPLLVYPTL